MFLFPTKYCLNRYLRGLLPIEIVVFLCRRRKQQESVRSSGKTSGANISTGRLPYFTKMANGSPACIRTAPRPSNLPIASGSLPSLRLRVCCKSGNPPSAAEQFRKAQHTEHKESTENHREIRRCPFLLCLPSSPRDSQCSLLLF